jgi:hypothetical protein
MGTWMAPAIASTKQLLPYYYIKRCQDSISCSIIKSGRYPVAIPSAEGHIPSIVRLVVRVAGRAVIMHMCLFRVLLVLVVAIVVVAVGQIRMVVCVGVPIRPVFELSHHSSDATDMMVSDVIMVVGVRYRRMGMRGLFTLSLSRLSAHHVPPSHGYSFLSLGVPQKACHRNLRIAKLWARYNQVAPQTL